MRNKIILLIITVCTFIFQANAVKTILPNDPNIQYIGRFDMTNVLSPKVSWTGTQIVAKFEGTSLSFKMTSTSSSYYNVTIDSIYTTVLVNSSSLTYSVASGLKDTVHTVTISKREAPWNFEYFNGLLIDDGKNLLTPPERKIRKIEFYGDSQTQGAQVGISGYGNDTNLKSEDNNYFSYASITARALRAEYSIIAQSGATLNVASGKLDIPGVFDRAGASVNYSLWDFASWTPDVVCINLGINDYPSPTITQYVNFVTSIRTKYPNAYIFLLAGPMSYSTTLKTAISGAVTQLNSNGDTKVYYFNPVYRCFHWGHPRAFDNVEYAKELVTKIKTVIWSEIGTDIPVEDVYITATSTPLGIGATLKFNSTVSPFDATDKTVKWYSSNPAVATVDATGLVTGVSAGTAIIQVVTNNQKKKSSITINVSELISGNQLLNPGFENGLTNWISLSSSNSRLNRTFVKAGTNSFEIGTGTGGCEQAITTVLVPGSKYTLSAWCKILTGTPTINLNVNSYNSNGTSSYFSSTNITSTEYEQKVLTFTLPANAVGLVVNVYKSTSGSTVLLDNFELVKGDIPTEITLPKLNSAEFKMYPNPLIGRNLIINSTLHDAERIFSISDLTGKIIFSTKLQNTDNNLIDLSGIHLSGMYVAKLTGKENCLSQLLVIQ